MNKKLLTAFICLIVSTFAIGQAVPNPSFSTWTTHGTTLIYQVPTSWSTIDSFTAGIPFVGAVGFVTKDSINPHSANYDIKLQSKAISTYTVPGVACSGIMHIISVGPPAIYNVQGGFSVTGKPGMLTGWYRDSMPGVDTGYIVAIFTKWDVTTQKRDTVAHGALQVTGNHLSWTQFQFNIVDDSTPAVTPDTGYVVLVSGKSTGGVVGSTLWVDDLALAAGINEVDVLNGNYELYPNPVGGTLYVKNNNFFKHEGFITVYDSKGRKISTSALNDNTTTVNTKSLAKGIYFYEIGNANQAVVKKGKFIVGQ